MDIAQLGISVDSRQVKTATGDLAGFATAAGKAEKATDGLEKASGRFYDASGRLREANGRFVQGAEKAASATSLLSGGINGATTATQAFGGALASLGIAAATSQLVKMADTYGLLQSKIGLATGEITKAAEATDMVFAAAQRARVGLDELGSMVARLAPSIRDMGGSTQDAVAASELFAKTLKISGATAEESASAILQFGQALGTGRLGGEEFNAVNESSGRYMQLLAKELGVTRGELKKMAEDGKLTGDVLINALANNATVLEGEFQQLRVTGAETFEQLSNSTMQAAFEIDKASGVSQTFNGIMNAGRGIIDAVTLALRDTNSTASDTSIIVPTVTKVFQTLGIVAAETVYVFKETGRTLGALAAQAAALAQGDLDLYKRIGEERDRDSAAARAAVDKLTASIANSETATAKLAMTAPKLSTGLKAVKTSADDNSKALKAAQRIAEQAADAYGDLERSLRKQLLTEDELTTAQKVSMDLTDKRYKHLSDQQKANLIALAKEVDAFKAQEKLFKDMAASAQELADSDTKRQQAAIDAAYQSRKAAEDQLAKLQEEADTYGMTEAEIQRYLLAKAEEKLALEKGGEARQGVIDQLEREIEARKQLTTATGAAETKKATEALGGAVQGTIADAIKAGLNADNPIKGFAQSLGNSVKNALYDAVAKGLAARITGAFSFGAASGAASAAGGGTDAGSLLGLLGAATGGNSIGAGLAGGALGGEFGIFANAGNVSNLALAGYGLAGGLFGNLIGAGKTGSSLGGLGAAGGALIGGLPGAAIGGLAGSVLGGVLGGAWKGGGGQKFGGEGAIGRANAGLFPEGQTDAQVQAALQTFSTGLNDVAKQFKAQLGDIKFAYGYETDPQGTAGNFFSSVLEVNGEILRNVQVQKFSGEVSDQMAAEFKTATVLALKAANLSADLQTAFDGFDPAIEGAADKVLARLTQIQAVADAFDSLGKAMPQLSGLSLAARESIIQLAGGTDSLASSISAYYESFYSEAERANAATEQLTAQMSGLGLAMPETMEGFRALVEAQDLTTESGQKTYAALMGMSSAFAAAANSSQSAGAIAKERAELELRLLQEQGNATEVLRRTREAELAAVHETNRAIAQQIQAEQDRKAKAAAEAAIAAQRAELEKRLLEAQGKAEEALAKAREDELKAVDEANKKLLEAIYAEQDRKAKEAREAAEAAERAALEQRLEQERIAAAERAAAKEAEIAKERESLAIRLMQERGQAEDALTRTRKAELAAVNETNQTLLKAIYAEQDRKAKAAKEAEIAQQRASIETRLLEAQGKAAEILARNRKAELAAIDATNRALLESLFAEQDRQAAIQTADAEAQSSLQKLRQSVDAEKAAIASALQVTISTLEDRAKAEKLTAETIFKAQTASIKSARETQKAVFEAAKDAAQGSISKLGDVLSLVTGKQVETADDVATTLARRQSALSSLSSIGAGVRAGEDAGKFQEQLTGVMGVISESGADLYASFADYQFDQRRANAEIASIEQGTKSQLSVAEQTLRAMIEADKQAERLADEQLDQLSATYELQREGIEKQLEQDKLAATAQAERDAAALDAQVQAAESQYNALMSIDVSVKSVKDATVMVANGLTNLSIQLQRQEDARREEAARVAAAEAAARLAIWNAQQAALAAEKAKASGSTGVPYRPVASPAIDGSHRNGLDAVPFDGYRAELHAGERVLTAQQADSSDKMAADIAEMRREMASAMLAIADNTRRTARLQERWDGDGLPDSRGY